MYPDRLSHVSQCMATISLVVLSVMLLFNSAYWLFPALSSVNGGYGLRFSLTDHLISSIGVPIESLPWWQLVGGCIISGIPSLALFYGLYHLRLLFKLYGQRQYFCVRSAISLGKIGKSIIIWTVLNLLFEPLLSYWLTFRQGFGQRVVSFSFDSQDVIALFLAACIILIAKILRQASELSSAKEQFLW